VFTVIGAMEYALAQQDRKHTPLSVEFLNWASNAATGDRSDGSFFSDLWIGYLAHGVCPEADMAYQPAFDFARRPSEEALARAVTVRRAGLGLHWIKPWDVNTGLSEKEFAGIKRVLTQQWPVCGGFRWPKQERWTSGILEMAPPEGVFDGHSVLLVGFRDDPALPGGGAFLIRNSGRGEHDAAMSYAYVRAYMNDALWIEPDAALALAAAAPSVESLLNPMAPAPAGRNRRVSSNQQPDWHTENLDMNWLMPGQSVEMPLLEGPGVITHCWFTSHAGWVGELNALVLRIYWDGRLEPDVEVPLGDFFAVGHGKPAVVESVPVQVSPTGSMSCYWRMPFRRSARIVVTNDNPDRSTGLYWQVDWVQLPALPPGTPRFHAAYRCEYPARSGRDYLLADLEGSGFYVGSVLSVTLAQDGWFGEGDDFFTIDGESVPSLQGTGTEDYFNDAWGFRPRTGHWFGQPRWQGDRAGDSGVCYRWHLPDPVHFTKSLRVEIEHKGNYDDDLEGFFLERPEYLSSVAYWYQTGEPKRRDPLPSWAERRVPWESHHFVRAFRQVRTTGSAKAEVQTTGFFGARPVLRWAHESQRAELSVPFAVAAEGRYALRLTAGSGPDGGTYDLLLDGRRLQTARFRTAETAEVDLALGTHALAAGEHRIGFRAVRGRQGSGPLVVEALRTLRLPPPARRTEFTHHEAHFVRLGIGRAVYAYRLAHGALPESLEVLVRSGILPARYENDENNRPLTSRVEGGRFVVESPGPGGWRHQWQGLDARR